MAITYHPTAGQLLVCDFSQGFKEPEMVKSGRPVLVIATRQQLVTVVAISTVEPPVIGRHHMLLDKADLPQLGRFQEDPSWLKGDMIYTVGFHRLDLIRLNKRGPDGKRLYFTRSLPLEKLIAAKRCVLYGLNLGMLAQHLPGAT